MELEKSLINPKEGKEIEEKCGGGRTGNQNEANR